VTDVLISGVLGAAVFAIALLYRMVRRNSRLIAQLHAENTAAKIAAITGCPPAAPTLAVVPDAGTDPLATPRATRRGATVHGRGRVSSWVP
jgi:hypothetical protein